MNPQGSGAAPTRLTPFGDSAPRPDSRLRPARRRRRGARPDTPLHPLLAGAGLALGTLLHLLIALTPPPNNASAFSVAVLVRYFFFHPAAVSRAATDPRTLGNAAGGEAAGPWLRASDRAPRALLASLGWLPPLLQCPERSHRPS